MSSFQEVKIFPIQATIKPNTVKEFQVGFYSLGEPSCALVTFDSGLMNNTLGLFGTDSQACNLYFANIPNLEFVEQYQIKSPNIWSFSALMKIMGLVKVNVELRNKQIRRIISTNVSVSKINSCEKPQLSIKAQSSVFYQPVVYNRSQMIIISTVTLLSCSDLSNVKNWLLFRIDPLTGLIQNQIQLFDNPTIYYSELVIKPNTLDYGLYRVIYRVNMSGEPGFDVFVAEVDTYLKIQPSGIIIRAMSDNSVEITRGFAQSIELNPTLHSYDLDDYLHFSQLKFKFDCVVIEDGIEITPKNSHDLLAYKLNNQLEMSSNLSCFSQREHYSFDYTQNILIVHAGSLPHSPNKLYKFTISTLYLGQVFSTSLSIRISRAAHLPIVEIK
jgi:hypothetical protein